MEKHWERLKRLRDRLEDMQGKWKPFGYGILRPSVAADVSLAVWELAEAACKPYFFDRSDSRLHRPRRWLDRTPDGTYCVQWWAYYEEEGVEAFKKWAEDVQVAFTVHSVAAPELFVPSVRPVPPASAYSFGPSSWKPPSGHYWTLNALAKLAIQNPQWTHTKERVVLDASETPVDVRVIPTQFRSLNNDDLKEEPSVKISFLEIEEDAIRLGLRSLDQLIATEEPSSRLSQPPLLYADVEDGGIYVKGKAVVVDHFLAQAVAILIEANGAWVKGREIRKKLGLPKTFRLNRLFRNKKLPSELRELIESESFTGYRIRPADA
jgi:hypothetical protein